MTVFMRDGEAVNVVLSERNVSQLLDAFRKGFTQGLQRRCENGLVLRIRVESDSDHYKEREAGPGFDHLLQQK